MEVTYDEAYAVYFHSFEDDQDHFHSLYTNKELAKLAAKLHDEHEHNGYWCVVKYWWDVVRNKWRKGHMVR